MPVTRLDSKGRIMVPKGIRQRLELHPGDVVVLELSGQVVRLAKAPNPFDSLAEQAEQEHRTGQTRELRDIIRGNGLSLGR